jgi:lipopolysaccharide/colanic/teichoic acid biosynthesis glycosyltransferase
VDRGYREVVQPAKLAMDAEYLATRSPRADLAVLGMTIGQVLRRTGRP